MNNHMSKFVGEIEQLKVTFCFIQSLDQNESLYARSLTQCFGYAHSAIRTWKVD